jgi:hypothetical protein
LADLRLVHAGRQVPYILECTSISRVLTPQVTATTDTKERKLSRWIVRLPKSDLPVTRLSCTTRTPLFQRDMTLWEELTDNRGAKYRRHLAGASWTRTPGPTTREFVLTFAGPLESDTLFLETHNGDNPPIELEEFRAFYPATFVRFKGEPGDAVFLYYGNTRATAPRYDLNLVAGELLAADKSPVSLAAEEQLRKSSWAESRTPGRGGLVFWGILAVVVAVLLIIIARLLPKASQATK